MYVKCILQPVDASKQRKSVKVRSSQVGREKKNSQDHATIGGNVLPWDFGAAGRMNAVKEGSEMEGCDPLPPHQHISLGWR